VRLSSIAHLYRVRLKVRAVLVQEMLAVLGLAVSVALLFASQVSSASLDRAAGQMTAQLFGRMQLQLDARSSAGFDQRLLGVVQRLAGVRQAVPVLERPVNAVGPSGERGVDLVGTDPRFALHTSPILRHFHYSQIANLWALAIPAPIARGIGVQPFQPILLQVAGRNTTAVVGAEVSAGAAGALANSPVLIAPLAYAQHLSGMSGRITRVFVRVAPGRQAEVRASLHRLAGGTLNVEPATFDATLFRQAAAPITQSTVTFAAICALVGLMFAYCAMLLTTPLRLALIRSLRANGATRRDVVQALIFDALALGVPACLLGLAFGELLSVTIFQVDAGYLSIGFPIALHGTVTFQSVTIAVAGGLLASCAGVLTPLRRGAQRPSAATGSPRARAPSWTILTLAVTAGCLALTTVILLAAPALAILGIVTLLFAFVAVTPLLFSLVVSAFERLQSISGCAWSRLAVVELRSPKTRTRSLAIAATGAIAVFGSVTMQGSHANLQHGLDRLVEELSDTADLWVVPPGAQNLLATTAFQIPRSSPLGHITGVRSVAYYRASFLDFGKRRVWVLAPPSSAHNAIPAGQLVAGNRAVAARRLRAGGWAVLSQALAAQYHLDIGQRFMLPAPRPAVFRIAALSTNLGWPPGAMILSPKDYVRAWGSTDPSAINITLRSGVSSERGAREVRQVLGSRSGLIVQSAGERESLQQTASRQGLGRLVQMSLLVLIAGALAMATAMGAMVSQRRRQFARMKVQGYSPRVLWYALLCESALLLGTGCLIGALFGIYGQLLLSHALLSVTGFPVVFSNGIPIALGSVVLVTVSAAMIVAIPGYRAARVSPYV
jgi:putative ABC transport system permease protein